jgi:hypothetical protein
MSFCTLRAPASRAADAPFACHPKPPYPVVSWIATMEMATDLASQTLHGPTELDAVQV